MKKVLVLIALACSFSFADALDDYLSGLEQKYQEAKDRADEAKRNSDRLQTKEGQEELQKRILEERKRIEEMSEADKQTAKAGLMNKLKEEILNKNSDSFVETDEINSFTDVEVKPDEADIAINYNERREYVN